MIDIPDKKMAYDFENGFYLTCSPGRVGKLIAHYELYKKALKLPGVIIECGVFKGASFTRLAIFRELFESSGTRKIIGFDTFNVFPESTYIEDKSKLASFIGEAGNKSISKEQLEQVLDNKQCGNMIELIEGDILETVPDYIDKHPELKIALLHLDVDIYEPSKCSLQYFYARLVKGGILILDDYGIFPGATKAIDDFFEDKVETPLKFPFSHAPSYIIKD